MQLHDPNDMMLITPDGQGGYTVISRGELEGWIRKVGESLEFAHVDDPSNWLPAGNTISDVRDFIIANYS